MQITKITILMGYNIIFSHVGLQLDKHFTKPHQIVNILQTAALNCIVSTDDHNLFHKSSIFCFWFNKCRCLTNEGSVNLARTTGIEIWPSALHGSIFSKYS